MRFECLPVWPLVSVQILQKPRWRRLCRRSRSSDSGSQPPPCRDYRAQRGVSAAHTFSALLAAALHWLLTKQGGIAVDRETGAYADRDGCRWNGGGEERDQPGHQGPTCRCRRYCGTTAGPSMRNRRSRPPTSELGVGPLSLPRPRDGKCCSGARPRPPIEAGRRPRVRAASRAAGGARARKRKRRVGPRHGPSPVAPPGHRPRSGLLRGPLALGPRPPRPRRLGRIT
jgi:hypothetical protein